MSESTQVENPLHNFIVSAVQSAWDDTDGGPHKALLLSALGKKLKDAFGDYSADFPRGIKEFLRTWPLVQVVQHPDISEKIGLIPAAEPLPTDVTTLFQKSGERRGATPPISYDQLFWDAFVKPIHSTRHVIVRENGQFQILNDAMPPPIGAFEITKEDLSSPDQALSMYEKVAVTRERIRDWLAKNSLSASQFSRKPGSRATDTQDRLISLKHAFEKISDEDKARILIPLDIILKIVS